MLQTELEFDVYAVAPALTDANLTDAIENCLEEDPFYGLCSRYGLITTKFGTMPNWDMSQVTTLNKTFEGATEFNGDISAWDTSQVTNMYEMFFNASAFNQDIGNWNTSRAATSTRTIREVRATATGGARHARSAIRMWMRGTGAGS